MSWPDSVRSVLSVVVVVQVIAASDSRDMTPGRRRRSAAGYLKYDVRGAALRNAGKSKDVGRGLAQRSDGVSSARLMIGRACTARDT